MRRAHEHQPALPRKLEVVAIAPLAGEKALVFEPLLGARRAKARGCRIELDLQAGRSHGRGKTGKAAILARLSHMTATSRGFRLNLPPLASGSSQIMP